MFRHHFEPAQGAQEDPALTAAMVASLEDNHPRYPTQLAAGELHVQLRCGLGRSVPKYVQTQCPLRPALDRYMVHCLWKITDSKLEFPSASDPRDPSLYTSSRSFPFEVTNHFMVCNSKVAGMLGKLPRATNAEQ